MFAVICPPTPELVQIIQNILALPEEEQYQRWMETNGFTYVKGSTERGKTRAFRNWQNYLRERLAEGVAPQ